MFSRRFVTSRAGAFLFTASVAPQVRADSLFDVVKSAREGTRTPALGAVVIRNGKVDGIAVWGVRSLGHPERAQNGDSWFIGSCTKPITASLVARLVDHGALSWDSPLSAMLPELAQTMRPEYRSVTLLQMLSHRSGLPHDDEAALEGHDFFVDRRPLQRQRLDYITQALRQPPVVAPGTTAQYSNSGFILAGVIAEHATGMPYESLIRREIFTPLGMASAGFTPPEAGELRGHRNGQPAKLTDSAPLMFGPAGLLRLSLADWAKFCLDQLAGAKGRGKLLAPATYHLMQNPLPDIEDGLDWGIDPGMQGRKGPVLEHTGTDRNWYALVNLFPGTGDGLMLAANAGQDMGGDIAVNAALKALLPTVSTAW